MQSRICSDTPCAGARHGRQVVIGAVGRALKVDNSSMLRGLSTLTCCRQVVIGAVGCVLKVERCERVQLVAVHRFIDPLRAAGRW